MFYVLRCPKCYVYRTGESKNKSWRCYRCQYNMNRKNTKIQAKANTIEEVQFVLNKLKSPEG
jgi:ribosomal protein L37AE/L43A